VTQTELGRRIGKTQSYIAQKKRLLKLPEAVQAAIDAGDLAEGHGRQLLRLDDPCMQAALSMRAIDNRWSVDRMHQAVDAIENFENALTNVSEALMAIRDRRLYRAEAPTFEDYCKQRWGLSEADLEALMVTA
jgi:ParB family chromosome partitioning protein